METHAFPYLRGDPHPRGATLKHIRNKLVRTHALLRSRIYGVRLPLIPGVVPSLLFRGVRLPRLGGVGSYSLISGVRARMGACYDFFT